VARSNGRYRILTAAIFAGTLLVACAVGSSDEAGEGAADGASAAGDTVVGDSADVQPPPDVGARDLAERWAARVPEELLVRRGACPFECCTYGDWTARAPYHVYAAERDTGEPVFTVPTGTTFHADSGSVHISGIALVAVADSVRDGDYWAFGAGDTLLVLDYIGEGHYHVWHDGEVRDVEGFWGAERMPLVAELLGHYEAQWWVHVTLSDGRTGWIRNDPPRQIDGADRCAVPIGGDAAAS
jgi:hypothetical protein